MEFLYRLYSNNYFGIGLFIVITILAFSFLVILFFGKKDEKARESKKLIDHIENRTNEEKTTVEPISIDRTETKENIIETPIMDEKIEFKDETSGLGLENKEAFEKIENDLFRSDSFTQNIENTEEPSAYERPLIREEEVYQERTPIIEEKEECVAEAVRAAGLEIIEVTRQGEWVSITARKS